MQLTENIKSLPLIHLYMVITLIIYGLLINLIQFILFFTLKFYSINLYRKLNYYLSYSIYAQILFIAEWWSGTDCTIYVHKEDFHKYYGKEHAYYIINHAYDIDWIISFIFCDRLNCLGNIKGIAKNAIKYIPIFGWCCLFSEYVFLRRSFEEDKEKIIKQTQALLEYEDPITLWLCPEGTRFTPSKHKISLDFARKNNLPELKHHLLPRSKGFITSMPALKQKNVPVYNGVFVINNNETSEVNIINLLLGKPFNAHLYLHRIPNDQIPDDRLGQEKFLNDMFVIKDKLVDSFLNTGNFFTTSGVKKEPGFKLKRQYRSLAILLFCNLMVHGSIIYYLGLCICNGAVMYVICYVLFIATAYIILKKTTYKSKLMQHSSYGTESYKQNK